MLTGPLMQAGVNFVQNASVTAARQLVEERRLTELRQLPPSASTR
jgi:hypothetical protein